MKTVCKKLLSLMLVAMLLVSAVPFQAFATEGEATDPTETTAVVETTEAIETTEATEAAVVTTVEDTASVPAVAMEIVPIAQTKDITLWAPYGTGYDSGVWHTLTVGQPFNFPNITFAHHTLKYWYYSDGVNEYQYQSSDIVSTSDIANITKLEAKFVKNQYTVNYQKFNGSNWIDSGYGATVDACSTVSAAAGTFPTDAQIAASFALPGYTIVGWEIGDTDNAFTPGATQITGNITVRPRYQRTVTLMVTNPIDHTSSSYKTMTVEIGETIAALPDPGARDGFAFVDWAYKTGDEYVQIATKTNLTPTAEYYPIMGEYFYARYNPSITVYLYIHTNGNTQTATKIVPYYEVTANGSFDTKTINMYSIFSSYGNYDDNGDAAYGWYDALQWEKYCTGKAANVATVFNYATNENGVQIHPEYCELHIMLIDNGNNSTTTTYNTNTNTADSSNPTTGDYIMMAVTVMAVSAAALAMIIFMKKRKASK